MCGFFSSLLFHLAGLGMKEWLTSEDSDEEELLLEAEAAADVDGSPSFREMDVPAGLKNLGNTCYVNSFLQIWFHNAAFRQALYEWDPALDSEERENESLLVGNYEPRGKVASLQLLFVMMEFTNRRAVDPNDFITKLGLDPQVQQDAQEFSKLFMSLLESSLAAQENRAVQKVVQDQFRGRYAYVTTCCHCGWESKRPTEFYELDLTLQGNKTLSDCLKDYTKEEKLEGDNQYFCEGCNTKRDATRCVRLLELPPVLNMQLNRFIFDMQTGRKKKLNSSVQFPEQVDMSSYLRQKEGTSVYCLTGVLMHVGAEANHGHYLAHIQEARSGQWFKFSDTVVERLAGKNPKLGVESDPMEGEMPGAGSAASKKSKSATPLSSSAKGTQTSNNAYMLVYTEQNTLRAIRRREAEKSRQKKQVEENSLQEELRGAMVAKTEATLPVSRTNGNSPAPSSKKSNGGLRRGGQVERTPVAAPGGKRRRMRQKVSDRLRIMRAQGDDTESEASTDPETMEDLEDIRKRRKAAAGRDGERGEPVKHKEEEEKPQFMFQNGMVFPKSFPQYLISYVEQDRAQQEEDAKIAQEMKVCNNTLWQQQTDQCTCGFCPDYLLNLPIHMSIFLKGQKLTKQVISSHHTQQGLLVWAQKFLQYLTRYKAKH